MISEVQNGIALSQFSREIISIENAENLQELNTLLQEHFPVLYNEESLQRSNFSENLSNQYYKITDLPNVFPLNEFKHALSLLETSLLNKLQDVKIKFRHITKEHLFAMPNKKEIYLMSGLFSTIQQTLLCVVRDVHLVVSKGNSSLDAVTQCLDTIQTAAIDYVAESLSPTDKKSLFRKFFALLQALNDYPEKVRPEFIHYHTMITYSITNGIAIFAILHEIGHVSLGHSKYSQDMQGNHHMEYGADEYAIKRMLAGIEEKEDHGFISQIPATLTLMSILEFRNRLRGVKAKESLRGKSLTHPAFHRRRHQLIDIILTYFLEYRKDLYRHFIDYFELSYSIHIYLSNTSLKLKRSPLLPFVSHDNVNKFRLLNLPIYAINSANDIVKHLEEIPYEER